MNHKIETTRYGNTTLNAEFTMELLSNSDVEEAIDCGTAVLMQSIAKQKQAIDKAELDFFITKKHGELCKA